VRIPARRPEPPAAREPARAARRDPPPARSLPDRRWLQAKLRLGAVDDPLEREADRVAEAVVSAPAASSAPVAVQRKCGACAVEEETAVRRSPGALPVREEEEKLQTQRSTASSSSAPEVGPRTAARIGSLRGGGAPMSPAARAYFEPHFGRDLSAVRLHTGAEAAAAAGEVGARAFTVGSDVAFGAGEYRPESGDGRKLLAHELAHTVQQGAGTTVRRAPLSTFRTDLEGVSPDHATIVSALFSHPRFLPIVAFLDACPGGTVDFFVRRVTDLVGGRVVERFGGFSPSSGAGSPAEMEVNPFHPQHAANPIELADTVIHELIHACLELRATCESAANPFPLPADVFDQPHDPELTGAMSGVGLAIRERATARAVAAGGTTTTSGRDLIEYLEDSYGPGASNPQSEYVDLNVRGNELVTGILRDVMTAHPGIGSETVSFDNVELASAAALLATRSWLNASQFAFSKRLFKNQVAAKRQVDPASFTDREYQISAIQVVESADRCRFDPNTGGGWGPIGGVWVCHKRSRFSGRDLRTIVTGSAASQPGGAVGYTIVQHT
jgi:hypothetical protein